MSYKYENRYIKYDLTTLFRQNLISFMWNNDSEKMRSNSGTKFVPFKLYLVHKRSLEKISSYFDTIPVKRNRLTAAHIFSLNAEECHNYYLLHQFF